MNRATIAIVIAIVALGAALLPLALGGGELGVTNFDSLTLSEDLVVGDDLTISGDTTHTGQLTIVDDLKVGNGTPDVTLNGEDAYIEGTSEFDGAMRLDGAIDLNGVVTNAEDLEHIGLPTWHTAAFTYTAAAGGTVTLATIGAGETWIVHDVRVDVTSNFNATGDDATLVIGDGNDPDGFCVLADAELQAADTEGTGWSAGWQCQVAATRGVYIDGTGGFVYDEASSETIDAVISESSGTTLAGGAATVHILYTRIQ